MGGGGMNGPSKSVGLLNVSSNFAFLTGLFFVGHARLAVSILHKAA